MTASAGDIGIDELVRRIRDEAARRTATAHRVARDMPNDVERDARDNADLPRWQRRSGKLTIKSRYTTADFLAFDGEDFVRNAYTGILKREADQSGQAHFLEALQSGQWNKIEVLGRLRYSREGRARGVSVDGLLPRFLLQWVAHVPVLGSAVVFLVRWITLPGIARDVDRLCALVEQRQDEARQSINAVAEAAERSLRRLHGIADKTGAAANGALEQLQAKADTADLETLRRQLRQFEEQSARSTDVTAIQTWLSDVSEQVSTLHRSSSMVLQKIEETSETLRQTGERLGDRMEQIERQVSEHDRGLADQRRLWAMREREGDKASRSSEDSRPTAVEGKDHRLDAFYVAFEDAFRGSREEIRDRVSVYLDFLATARAGSVDAPIVDLGCGRGELLEVLRDAGMIARGVDLNRYMLAECRERGLDVQEADLLAHLRGCGDGSLGAVTALHVIEHLPFEAVIELFDQTLRVLRPGGMAIFETPNPENLIVGSCNFYYDPTHRNPLPPEAMRFAMAARGFSDVRILRLRPVPLPDSGPDPTMKIVHDLLSAAPDYAIIGVRA
ncbi:MAG: methyltransferase domain-containing protein [Deltaproteobacteria bacterium]